jgi:hypothetical protein
MPTNVNLFYTWDLLRIPILFTNPYQRGYACSWFRNYSTSRKVAGSSPNEVFFFSIYLIKPHHDPVVDSASKRNQYQEFSWGKGRPERNADNLIAISEPIV